MDIHSARHLANEILEHIAPFCERAEIAGSVRRGKADVKDIEIVCIPKPRGRPSFGDAKPFKTELDALLYSLCNSAASPLRMKALKGGDKYKQFHIPKAGVNLDLFIVTPPAQWGVQFVIRTGPAEFSQWVVTQARKGGALPDHCKVDQGAVWRTAGDSMWEVLPTPEEQDFFNLLHLDWKEPGERRALWGKFAEVTA